MENFIGKNTRQQQKPLTKKPDNFLAEIQEKKTVKKKNEEEIDRAQELKGNLPRVVDFFKMIKEYDEVKTEIQQLVFAETLPKKPYKLIEVSKKMAEEFKNGQELVFRGNADDYAVLCSSNKTYDVKDVETSNSLILVPYLQDHTTMEEEGEKTIAQREITMVAHHYIELKEIECVSAYKLRELLHENELRWDWETSDKEDHKYSYSDLLDIIRMSEEQLKTHLAAMPVIEHKGYLRWLSYDFHDHFIEEIISLTDDYFKKGVSVEKVTFEGLRQHLPTNACDSAITWFLENFCTKLDDEQGAYKMEERPLVRSRASYILRNVSSIDTTTFERHVDQMLPAGIELNYSYLDGIAIVAESFKGKTISYLNVEDLPENPKERLKILFERKSSWRMDEVSPYLSDICANSKAMSGLMVSHCRASKDSSGEKVFCSLRPFLTTVSWSSLICCPSKRKDSFMEMMQPGLKGGASCSHRAKKTIFVMKEVRKKLKTNKRCCEECERIKNEETTAETTGELLVCVSCGRMSCETHAKTHCEAARTEPHPVIFSITKGKLRCHPCDVELESEDDPKDPVRNFYNEYKSFAITKADNDAKKLKEKEDKEEPDGKADTASGAIPLPPPPPPAPSPTKPITYSSLFKNNSDNNDKMITRNDAMKFNRTNGFEDMETMTPAKGLTNLGNTCFFNSVMQCIMHTHHIDHYCHRFGRVNSLEYRDKAEITVNEEKLELEPASMPVPVEDCPLNDVVRCFIGEFRHGQSPAPNSVFSQISKKAPRFKGWQQQDAHELLRYLLDGLRSEEQERYKTAIANHFGVPKDNRKKTDPLIVKKAKGYLQVAGRPLLDSIFGGTLLQTIRCCECEHISDKNEEFLDLSVPMSVNPMSAGRLSAGANGKPSAHQLKKAAKDAKKAAKLQARQQKSAAKKNGQIKMNGTSAPIITAVDECELAEEEKDDDIMEDDEEMTSEESGEDEEEERLTGGGANRTDFTERLVEPPQEYYENRSVGACLLEFTDEEKLVGQNAYECEACCEPRNKKLNAKGNDKKRVEARKRYLIYEPPTVLTLQLKRFQQVPGYGGRLSTRKLGGHIDFPICLDIAPFCCKKVKRVAEGRRQILYSLYGVVVHSGDLSGGHYIAYVKSRHRVPQALEFIEAARSTCVDAMASPPSLGLSQTMSEPKIPDGQWYYCSDSHVRPVSEDNVLKAEAYILFYERLT